MRVDVAKHALNQVQETTRRQAITAYSPLRRTDANQHQLETQNQKLETYLTLPQTPA